MAANLNVFINCPFDKTYRPLLDALVFAVHDCGYVARSALELSDGGQVRISKIYDLIGECRFGIHDISLTELDADSGYPRFNMPLELGIFLGAKRFGNPSYRQKRCLVLVRQPYAHQIYCSDIAGQDPSPHHNDPVRAIRAVRGWLNTVNRNKRLPSAQHIAGRFGAFQGAVPQLCENLQLDEDDLAFNDLTTLVVAWLDITAPPAKKS